MRPRALPKLASRSESELLEELSDGLALIAEHVATLEAAIEKVDIRRASAAIRVVSDDEAGKYLILLDVARCARTTGELKSRQLKRAYSHLARGIYVGVTEIRPASFGELLGYVKRLRLSHYLDGPNDVDWIFRNEIEARREEQLYVDFVESDEIDHWQSPQSWDDLMIDPPSDAAELVASLQRTGVSTPKGLEIVADLWESFVPDPEMRWSQTKALSIETLERLSRVHEAEFAGADLARIASTWTFPLCHVELEKIFVDLDELRREQQNWYPDI